jgi:hypothetical protein
VTVVPVGSKQNDCNSKHTPFVLFNNLPEDTSSSPWYTFSTFASPSRTSCFWLVDGGPYTCSPRSLGGCTIRKVPLMEPTTANATLETVDIYILSNTGNSVSILLSLYCSCLCSWFLLSECCSSIAVGDGCTVLAPTFFIHFLRSAQTTKYLVTGRIHC